MSIPASPCCRCAKAATTGRSSRSVAAQLLHDHPDLIGLYNVGAGTRGIVAALEAAGRQRESRLHRP